MATAKKQVHGEVKISYPTGPDILLPVKFYASDLEQAEEVFIRQAIADLIVHEHSALDNALAVSRHSISIEE